MKKIHFTYITTNLVNNKQYVGDHSTYNINDSYLGSGLLIMKSITKYGKENFKKEILEICKSKEEAFNNQEKYIKEYNTLNPSGYNISPTGGHNVKNCFSEESKRKISKNRKGKCTGEAHPNFGKPLLESVKIKIGEKNKINSKGKNNGMFGKKQYDIWLKKYGKEKADIKHELWKKRISETQSGKVTSKNTKDKQKAAAFKRKKYICSHCNKEYDPGNFIQHIKSLERKEIVSEDWVLETLRDKEGLS